jgi:hypothetical protein
MKSKIVDTNLLKKIIISLISLNSEKSQRKKWKKKSIFI